MNNRNCLFHLIFISLLSCNPSSKNHSTSQGSADSKDSIVSTQTAGNQKHKNVDSKGDFTFVGNINFLKTEDFLLNGKRYNISNLSSISYSASEDLYYGVIDRLDWYDDNKAQIFKFKITTNNKVNIKLVDAIELKDKFGQELGFVDVEAIDIDSELNFYITTESADNRTLGDIDSSLLLKFSPEGLLLSSEQISQNLTQDQVILNPKRINPPKDLVLLSYPDKPEALKLPIYPDEIPSQESPAYIAPVYSLPDGLVEVPDEVYIKTAGDHIAEFSYNLFIGWWNGKVTYQTLTNVIEIENALKHNEKLINESKIVFKAKKEESRKKYLEEVNKWSNDWRKYQDWKDSVFENVMYQNDLAFNTWKNKVELIDIENEVRRKQWEDDQYNWESLERIDVGQDGHNLGIESLALDLEHNTIISVVEGALKQDPSDTTRIIVNRNGHIREYLYPLDHKKSAVSDIQHIQDNKILVLEKRFDSTLKKVFAKLYLVDLSFEVSMLNEIRAKKELLVNKTELLDLNLLDDHLVYTYEQINELSGVVQIDNLEGIALGPTLPDGRKTLVIVSDANRQLRTDQITQFIVLGIDKGVLK